MWQELFRLPWVGLPIHGYGLMVLIGALTGTWLLRQEAKRRDWDTQKIVDIGIYSVIGGLIGARIFYTIQFWDEQFSGEPFWHVFAFWEGGLVLYGGIIGGMGTLVVLIRRNQLPLVQVLDAAAPSLAIGIAFGRIGCFLNGCCWGQRCPHDFPLAVTFPAGAPADTWGPVLPTQLFSSVHAFLLAWILWRFQRGQPADGRVAGAFLLLYGVGRYMIESIRGDHGVSGFTVSQQVSFFVISLGVVVWFSSAFAQAASPRRA